MNILTRPGRNVLKPAMLVSSVALAIALAGCNGGGAGGASGSSSGGGETVATVNGTAIGREALHDYLESTGGDAALRALISNQLVLQAAKDAGLEVKDEDVDKYLAERMKANPAAAKQLEEIKTKGGVRYDALKRQIRYQMSVEKLVTKDIKVDEAALSKWFTANKANYETPATVKVGLLLTSQKAKADTMAQQLKGKTKTFAQLVDEQAKANDAVGKGSAADKDLPLSAFPKPLQDKIGKLKAGEDTGAITLAPNVFGIIRLESKVDAKSPTLADIRAQAERDYKQEQLARKEVAKNPSNPGFDKTVTSVQQMLMQQNMQQGNMTPPTKTDAYQYINNTAIQNFMAKLNEGAKVEFNDPAYSGLAAEFKGAAGAAPSAAGAPGAPSADASGHGPNDGHGH